MTPDQNQPEKEKEEQPSTVDGKDLDDQDSPLSKSQIGQPAIFKQDLFWESELVADVYAKFTEADWYNALNRELLLLINPVPGQFVVDLGCGTCSMSRALALKVQQSGVVWAVDNSDTMLNKARLLNSEAFSGIECISESASALSRIINTKTDKKVPFTHNQQIVDHVTSANAIHLFTNLAGTLYAVSKTLRPGGTFSFSTSFFRTPERAPRSFNRLLSSIRRAARGLQEQKGQEKQELKELTQRAKVNNIHLAELKTILGRTGFQNMQQKIVTAKIPPESIKLFVQLPHVKALLSLHGLKEQQVSDIVDQSMKTLNVEVFERDWLLFIAEKS